MAQVSEPRASLSAQPNIQDVFLNFARRDRLSVTMHLMDGRTFDARIKNFDKFAVVALTQWSLKSSGSPNWSSANSSNAPDVTAQYSG